MKQLLFLLLFPCLAMAQYQGNGNQKITLGEQTTADGLVYRGVANLDTVTATSKITRANKQDTSAYLLLDTVTNLLWHYKTASNGWIQAGGSTLDTASMLLPYWRSGRFSGVLPVANGGTNTSTAFTAGSVVFAGASGTYTQDNSGLFYNSTNKRLAVGQSQNLSGAALSLRGGLHIIDPDTTISTDASMYMYPKEQTGPGPHASEFSIFMAGPNSTSSNDGPIVVFRGNNYNRIANQKGLLLFASGTNGPNLGGGTTNLPATGLNGKIQFYAQHGIDFNVNALDRMKITSAGEVWIGYTADNGAYPLQVNGQIFATNATIATSDEKFKENITPLNKGLEIVNKLKPVTFNFIPDTKNNFSEYEEVGFIAQDVDRALSTETFSKSIVKAADDSEPTSTMGLATQNLIPILVKAIQEQNALIKALEQRILILENK